MRRSLQDDAVQRAFGGDNDDNEEGGEDDEEEEDDEEDEDEEDDEEEEEEDARVEASLLLREAISRVIRQVRPQVVLAQSAQRNLDRIYASHPDHLATGEGTICAVYPDARNPFAYPHLLADEGLEPWSVDEVWFMEGVTAVGPGVEAIDITTTVAQMNSS